MPEGGGLGEQYQKGEQLERGVRQLFETMQAESFTTTPIREVDWMPTDLKDLLTENGVEVVNKERKIIIPNLPSDLTDIPNIIRSRVAGRLTEETPVQTVLRNEAMIDTVVTLNKFVHTLYAMPDKFGNKHHERRDFTRKMRDSGKYVLYKEQYLDKNALRKNVLTDVASFLEASQHDYGVVDPALTTDMQNMGRQLLYLISGDPAHGVPKYEEMSSAQKIATVRISTDYAGEALCKMIGSPLPNKPPIMVT
jgi:hypothetical protein